MAPGALNAAALLDAWEAGEQQSSLQRGLILLAAAWPEVSREEWARTSIGRRDERLLALREELFGEKLEAVANCPQCSERLDLAFTTNDIRVLLPALPPTGEPLRVSSDGYEVQFRLPNTADLIEVAGPAAGEKRETLLGRCVLSASNQGLACETAELPAPIVKAVLDEMAHADPQADVQVALSCPACQHRWSIAFDILAYLWSEIKDWAHHLLHEIHALASVYGWSEREILSLSARRRRLYLEMLSG